MSKLAENQLLYKATTKVYSKRMALIKYAIQEGG
jgi:flagellar basal body rod protein FlgB